MIVRFYNQFDKLLAIKDINCIPPKGTLVVTDNKVMIVSRVVFKLETCGYTVFLTDTPK